uniref:SANT domain-containing protein n=1 Tax=Clastoptera arizonana TaxID=38151 RepID=A0A1B6E3G6_9HEMI
MKMKNLLRQLDLDNNLLYHKRRSENSATPKVIYKKKIRNTILNFKIKDVTLKVDIKKLKPIKIALSDVKPLTLPIDLKCNNHTEFIKKFQPLIFVKRSRQLENLNANNKNKEDNLSKSSIKKKNHLRHSCCHVTNSPSNQNQGENSKTEDKYAVLPTFRLKYEDCTSNQSENFEVRVYEKKSIQKKWSRKEKRLFEEKFPKCNNDFQKIASFFERRTAAECAYYYCSIYQKRHRKM